MYRQTLLIDLDGVLNNYTGNYIDNLIPPIREGAREFIISLSYEYDLKLFTTRSKNLAQKWLIENNLDKFFSEITNEKKIAWLIIDDRSITFKGNYDEILNQINQFKPWYKS